jgi:hypothetical protein
VGFFDQRHGGNGVQSQRLLVVLEGAKSVQARDADAKDRITSNRGLAY